MYARCMLKWDVAVGKMEETLDRTAVFKCCISQIRSVGNSGLARGGTISQQQKPRFSPACLYILPANGWISCMFCISKTSRLAV